MTNSGAKWLVGYGLFLMGAGFVAVMYEPKSAAIGFNPAAKTALISGGICGGLSIVWGVLLGRGFSWARIAAMVCCGVFFAAFTWRSIVGWMAFADGQSEKWFAATLITCMWATTLGMLALLARNRALGTLNGNAPDSAQARNQPANSPGKRHPVSGRPTN
ncbi:MAG: hypothetical protein IH623_10875 [Verrucomicrobia bacterium]|nr:hypothetical protein [Verrucomicrobiota bacterium]